MIDVCDRVLVLDGANQGSEGRVVLRKRVDVAIRDFFTTELVYGVDFEDGPNGRGYLVFYRETQLRRI